MENLRLTTEEHSALERLGIEALILFGSHAQNVAGPLSDFDAALDFRAEFGMIAEWNLMPRKLNFPQKS